MCIYGEAMAALKQYNLKISSDLLSTLKKEAKKLGVTQSQLIRTAVEEKLKQLERERFVEALREGNKTKDE
jgi:predicted DNA-binding protein